MFLPGDHSVLIGCKVSLSKNLNYYMKNNDKFLLKNGSLQIASLDSASIVETVQGHEENQSIWAMCMTPDRVKFHINDKSSY